MEYRIIHYLENWKAIEWRPLTYSEIYDNAFSANNVPESRGFRTFRREPRRFIHDLEAFNFTDKIHRVRHIE